MVLLALCGVASLGGGVGFLVWAVCLVVLLRAVVLVLARAARGGLLVAGPAQVLGRLGQARARLGCVILLAMRPNRRSNPTRPCFGGCCVTALLARVVVDARGVLARVVVVCMVGALARAWAVVAWGVWLARARAVVVSWGVCLLGSGAPDPRLGPIVLCG